jgi:hypothetical protein
VSALALAILEPAATAAAPHNWPEAFILVVAILVLGAVAWKFLDGAL